MNPLQSIHLSNIHFQPLGLVGHIWTYCANHSSQIRGGCCRWEKTFVATHTVRYSLLVRIHHAYYPNSPQNYRG